jgi:hypothetical protein
LGELVLKTENFCEARASRFQVGGWSRRATSNTRRMASASWSAVADADPTCLHALAELATEAALSALRTREEGGATSELVTTALYAARRALAGAEAFAQRHWAAFGVAYEQSVRVMMHLHQALLLDFCADDASAALEQYTHATLCAILRSRTARPLATSLTLESALAQHRRRRSTRMAAPRFVRQTRPLHRWRARGCQSVRRGGGSWHLGMRHHARTAVAHALGAQPCSLAHAAAAHSHMRDAAALCSHTPLPIALCR